VSQELQQNRYDQLIRRVGGLIGGGSKVSEALSELFPTIDVEQVPGELLALGGTSLHLGGTDQLGQAALTTRIQLFNPAGSGKLITVTQVSIHVVALNIIRFGVTNTALLTGLGVERFRDSRFGIAQSGAGQIRDEFTVATTDADGLVLLPANTNRQFKDRNGLAVLSPGFGYEFGTAVVNNRLGVTFWWRERVAEQSELNL